MKVPEPKKLPSGNYFIQLRLGGKSIPITSSTKADCKKEAMLIKAEYLNGKKIVKKTDITLSQAIDNYIAARENTLSPTTIKGYRTVQRCYYQSVMNTPLSKINNWQEVVDKEYINLSPKTVKNSWGFLCSVLHENEMDPDRITLREVKKNEKLFLQPEQIKPFIQAVKGKDIEIAALLGLHSLRRSEILGLQWSDIDLTQGQLGMITINRVKVLADKYQIVVKDIAKNTESNRTVPIFIPELRAALEAVPDKDGFVIKTYPNGLYTAINRICKENNFPLVGVHGLRHSFASLAYSVGLSEKQTMKIGGWSDFQTMRKIYTHLEEAASLKASNALTNFFADNPDK